MTQVQLQEWFTTAKLLVARAVILLIFCSVYQRSFCAYGNRDILRPMNWFIRWHEFHPIAFELILFALACLVSIFSTKLYKIVTEWPGRTVRSFRRGRAANQLKQISEIHNSAYQLVLYLAVQFLNTFLGILGYLFLFWAISKGELLKSPLIPIYSGVIVGLIIAKATETFQVLLHLSTYEQSVQKLNRLLGTSERAAATQAGK